MDRIQLRRDSSARWAEINPILLEGEVGFETDTKLRKIGDGVNRWNDLDYLKAEGIVQEKGDGQNVTMSQDAVTRELTELDTLNGGFDTASDLDINDGIRNTIARFIGGHIKTKNFDSRTTPTTKDRVGNFSISDENGNIIAIFSDGHIKTKNFDSKKVSSFSEKVEVNILSVGNSYAADALSYVPYLAENVGLNVNIGICIYSGCSLEQHYNFIVSDDSVYMYYEFNNENMSWTYMGEKSMSDIINNKEWNIVTFQQRSTLSPIIDSYQPYTNELIRHFQERLKNVIIGWILTQSSADGSGRFPDESLDDEGKYQTSETMYNGIVECVKEIYRTTPIKIVFPVGVSIQNARKTELNNLGDSLTSDGYHLNEGLPSLIAAYAVVQKLIDLFGIAKSVTGDKLRPTEYWLSDKNIPLPNTGYGVSLGVTDENCYIAQNCAINASKMNFNL